jgi:hypothetical protein
MGWQIDSGRRNFHKFSQEKGLIYYVKFFGQNCMKICTNTVRQWAQQLTLEFSPNLALKLVYKLHVDLRLSADK